MNTDTKTTDRRVMAAAITPCRTKGEADFAALRALCVHLAARGCDGLFVPSSTGEAALLDDETRRMLVRTAREACGDATEIWAGVSGLGLNHIGKLARSAAEEGANGVIVMAPFFHKLSQRELAEYCAAVADASPAPVGIYHHLRMPTAFEPETLAALAEHPNIHLYKETSGDLERLKTIVALTRGTPLRIYQGSEKLLLPSLEAGATGGITALANTLPGLHREIVDRFLAEDIGQAQAAQDSLEQFWKIFRLPELSGSFSLWLRSVTLPLCWLGLFPQISSVLSAGESFGDFDRWLKNYYEENGLMEILMNQTSRAQSGTTACSLG